MKQPILKITQLSARYENRQVLKDVDLTVYKNDFLGIIGPNGGGKTTLIKCILGLKQYDSGSIQFYKEGEEVRSIKMGYLPQYNLIDKKFPISVQDVVISGILKEQGITRRYSHKYKQKAGEVIQRMGLDGYENQSIGKLSGGQLQRALLGRAIIAEPDILILDEPNTYIDKKFEAKLYELLAELQKECAIILVSHDIGTVLQQVQTIACVNETLDYHPDTGVSTEWIEKNFHCPIELLGFGAIPHRVLGIHQTDSHKEKTHNNC